MERDSGRFVSEAWGQQAAAYRDWAGCRSLDEGRELYVAV